ncbi:testis-specific serine/threonine-protein kinase 6-like, partial [Salminus brasiliensis]|uniref:testis-specific serine/threonine-protein kinase 6-like n=1 Tax=Salminus brasiliensis TaxID=930266 RepID=UPI003B83161E
RENMETDDILTFFGYDVLSVIGEGTFGTVKLASSERHPNQVAIKIMDYEAQSQELTILRRVKHPHIVQVHEIIEMQERVYIVMEAAATDLLHHIVETGPIPTDQAKTWFSQLLSAVDFLHQQNIVHRDLKLNNVLLTFDGQIKLADFGLGCFSRGFPDLCKTLCGNPYYCAPEINMRQRYDPKKSDVWSLGVIYYAMVTASLPFYDSMKAMIPILQRRSLEYPEEVAVEEPCKAFISYMLQKDPVTRPSVKEVARHPWLKSRQVECFIGRFLVVPVDEEDGGSCSHQEVLPLQEDDCSGAGSVQVVREKIGCFSCASLKKAAQTYVAAPILRASRALQRRIRKFFKRTSMVHDFSSSSQQGARHSAASTEAPASSCSEQRREDGTPDILLHEPVVETEAVEAQPTMRQGNRRLRFPKFNVYPEEDEQGSPPVDIKHGSW